MNLPWDLTVGVVLWILVVMAIVFQRWKLRWPGTGLVLGYMLNLTLLHWVGTVIYLLPAHRFLAEDLDLTQQGFWISLMGLMGAWAGIGLAPLWVGRLKGPFKGSQWVPQPALARAYIVLGMFIYLVLQPRFGITPTVSALLSVGWKLVVAGVILLTWKDWQEKTHMRFWLRVAIWTTVLPSLSLLTQGFLGFGASLASAIFCFVATIYRPRWRFLLIAALMGYVGMSVYVTYMQERTEIREVVWGGTPMEERIEQLMKSARAFEWLDLSDPNHLWVIDSRLNQNYLVGAAVEYIKSGYEKMAYGRTLWDALVALIPRALWPEKPVAAGSMGWVGHYTGIQFEEGTSVGLGQVLELYINFGLVGVVVGCFLMGLFIASVDTLAGQRLVAGDWQGFCLRYLPGLFLIECGGSFVEITASSAAALLLVLLLHRFLFLQSLAGRRSTPIGKQG